MSPQGFSSSFSSSSSSSTSSSIGPEPPVILPDDGRPTSSGSGRMFLSNTPAVDSTIEVHTLQHEYQLHVKLPGFTWEGIVLSAKRKRILQVVANRWDNGGGHFERRVAFGYDADLSQVKAQFHGDLLRVSIPRRPSTVTSVQSTRPVPFGRTS